MTANQESTAKTMTIKIQTSQHDLQLIDRAATINEKTRSDFMLDAARQQAVDVLLDRTLFTVDDASYEAFIDMLDNPVPSTGILRELLHSRPPWE